MRSAFCLFSVLWLSSLAVFSQTAEEKGLKSITGEAVEAQLEFLSSDWTEGRATGTRGAYMAADYIASMFKLYGLEPGGDMETQQFSRKELIQGKQNRTYRSYYQNFPLIEFAPTENQSLSLIKGTKNSVSEIHFSYETDFSVSTGPVSQAGKADVVFTGYGMQDLEKGFDELSKEDLQGKIILRLAGYPGHKDSSSLSYNKFKPEGRRGEWEIARKKNDAASKSGAIAILEVDLKGESWKGWSKNIPFRFNTAMFESDERQPAYYDTRMALPGDSLKLDPPVFKISARMANEILAGSGINIEEFESEMARDAKSQSRLLKNTQMAYKTDVQSKVLNARNVVGILKGKDTSEIIVIGAHYDHVGKYNGVIWNGADDNASGTVGVMTIAKAFMATGETPEKTIVFAAWTGEEKGLWGSKYFVENPYNGRKVILNLNYDMISRDNSDDTLKNKCSMNYTQGYPVIEEITRKNINKYKLNLDVSFRPSTAIRGGSDFAPFAAKGIPYFYFMAGFPPEYHQPDDHIELVNFPKMTNIIRLGFLNVWNFANSQEWMEKEE